MVHHGALSRGEHENRVDVRQDRFKGQVQMRSHGLQDVVHRAVLLQQSGRQSVSPCEWGMSINQSCQLIN